VVAVNAGLDRRIALSIHGEAEALADGQLGSVRARILAAADSQLQRLALHGQVRKVAIYSD
jgi:hypothetical protein